MSTAVTLIYGGLLMMSLLVATSCRARPEKRDAPASTTAVSPPVVSVASATSKVPTAARIADVQLGGHSSVVKLSDGSVRAWGSNDENVLLFGGAKQVVTPRPVDGLRGYQQLSIGGFHACGVLADGAARCWGSNEVGQLGVGDRRSRAEPSAVVDLADVAEIRVCHLLSIARTKAGAVTWFGTYFGGEQARPKSLGMAPVIGIAAAREAACAWVADGSVLCWGVELGKERDHYAGVVGKYDNTTLPARIRGLSEVAAVSMGSAHACAVHRDGRVSCLGAGEAGQLGDGARHPLRVRPLPVPDLTGVIELALGADFSCARTKAGNVKCWGQNASGQLGVPGKRVSTKPVELPIEGAVRIGAGAGHACAAVGSGKLYCWGRNHRGQIGNGKDGVGAFEPAPVEVALDGS